MSAALGGLTAHRTQTGTISARKPADLRAEDPRPAGVTVQDAATVTAIVRSRLGATSGPVLKMLGLAS